MLATFGAGSAVAVVATGVGQGEGLHLAPLAAYGSGALVTGLATGVVKRTARRPRPYTGSPLYDGPSDCAAPGTGDACVSFFSGHTAFTAYNLFYAASMADVRRDEWSLGAAGVGLGYSVATVGTFLVGGARVGAGRHYWSDVAVGALVGTAVGLAAPRVADAVTADRPATVVPLTMSGAF